MLTNILLGSYRIYLPQFKSFLPYNQLVTIKLGKNEQDITLKSGVSTSIHVISDDEIPRSIRIQLERDLEKSPLPQFKLKKDDAFNWTPAKKIYVAKFKVEEKEMKVDAAFVGVYPGQYTLHLTDQNIVEKTVPLVIPENVKYFEKTVNISAL